jgi:hypothetical protein
LIFDLPWPAHRAGDVLDYPPAHLLPPNYLPPRITSVALPSLSKVPKRPIVVAPRTPPPESRDFRRARVFRNLLALEEFTIDQLRTNAWNDQLAREAAEAAKIEAKERAKREKEEAKEAKKRANAKTIKGSGVWSRYEYLSVEEMRRRTENRFKVTSGTRRGGRFRGQEDEEEMKALAVVQRREEIERRLVNIRKDSDEESEDVPVVEDDGVKPGDNDTVARDDLGMQEGHSGAVPVEVENGRKDPEPVTTGVIALQSESEASPSSPSDSRSASPPYMERQHGKPKQAKSTNRSNNMGANRADSTTPASKRRRGRPAGTGHLQKRAAALQKDLDKSASTSGFIMNGHASSSAIPDTTSAPPTHPPNGREYTIAQSRESTGGSSEVMALLDGVLSEQGNRSIETLSEDIEAEEAEVGLALQLQSNTSRKRPSDDSVVSIVVAS